MREGTEKKTRKHYDETFQRAAVDLWLKGGRSAEVVAEELGVHPWNLRDWKKRLLDPSTPGNSKHIQKTMTELEAENERLARENQSLRHQRDILKKSLGLRF